VTGDTAAQTTTGVYRKKSKDVFFFSRSRFGSRRTMHEVVIVSFARTAIGSMGGVLASLSAPALGSSAIKAAVERAGA
jgi:hypothetical protein